MDPHATTSQNDDIDPLELEDQELPDEETGELAHIEPDPLSGDISLAEEEQDLVKAIDKIAVPIDPPTATAAAAGAGSAVKKSSHIIPRDLIDRELTPDDLYDPGAL